MKVRLMFFHNELVKAGKLNEANRVLKLLCDKFLSIGLADDAGCAVEIALENRFHLKPRYSRDYNVCSFTLK